MAEAKPPVFNPITDLRTLALFLVTIWFIWFSTGGPARFESQKPFIKAPTKIGADEKGEYRDPSFDQFGSVPNPKISTNINVSIKYDGRGATYGSSGSPSKVNATRYRLFKKPLISMGKGSTDSTGKSYLKWDFPAYNVAPLTLTGLVLRDLFGRSVILPGASNLPLHGLINEERPVVITPGSSVYIIEGQSPIGVSFRINKCFGYLAEYQSFVPPISVYKLDQNLTYNTCVSIYATDPDFFFNDWRIYLNLKDKVWSETGDIIRIIDSSGNTLSSIFY